MGEEVRNKKLTIEIEFLHRHGFSVLNHNLEVFRKAIEIAMPLALGKITKFAVDDIEG